ncbi:hypothetical protein SDC9_172804 [bioreactor metagenome]|uniref:Uncharacterized protein n=1 Tax=bioreactor metagenome TaxID=1076179 RepID=A0A645GFC7_9ZZZZ
MMKPRLAKSAEPFTSTMGFGICADASGNSVGSGVAAAAGVDVAATDSLAAFLQEAKTKISTSATTMESTFFMARFLSGQAGRFRRERENIIL